MSEKITTIFKAPFGNSPLWSRIPTNNVTTRLSELGTKLVGAEIGDYGQIEEYFFTIVKTVYTYLRRNVPIEKFDPTKQKRREITRI
jgi:hypothetical protein